MSDGIDGKGGVTGLARLRRELGPQNVYMGDGNIEEHPGMAHRRRP
jgi:hypothetical protein